MTWNGRRNRSMASSLGHYEILSATDISMILNWLPQVRQQLQR